VFEPSEYVRVNALSTQTCPVAGEPQFGQIWGKAISESEPVNWNRWGAEFAM
jgi:hypothetical protein